MMIIGIPFNHVLHMVTPFPTDLTITTQPSRVHHESLETLSLAALSVPAVGFEERF